MKERLMAFLCVALMGIGFIWGDVIIYLYVPSKRTLLPYFTFIGVPLILVSIAVCFGWKKNEESEKI